MDPKKTRRKLILTFKVFSPPFSAAASPLQAYFQPNNPQGPTTHEGGFPCQ
jgi:hypothetical protein